MSGVTRPSILLKKSLAKFVTPGLALWNADPMPTTVRRVLYTLVYLIFRITLPWRHFYPPHITERELQLQRLSVCPRSPAGKQNGRGTASFPVQPCAPGLCSCGPALLSLRVFPLQCVSISPLSIASQARALEESVPKAWMCTASSWHRASCAHGNNREGSAVKPARPLGGLLFPGAKVKLQAPTSVQAAVVSSGAEPQMA